MGDDALRAENERLRAALEEGWLFEMTYQNEPDDPSVYSDGWMCAGCMDSWVTPNEDRPPADSREEVKHHPSCVLYTSPEQWRVDGYEAERLFKETIRDLLMVITENHTLCPHCGVRDSKSCRRDCPVNAAANLLNRKGDA